MFFCGLLFAGLSPGRNFAEFQETRAEGLLGKFDIACLHGHFGSRSSQQNVVLGWPLKKILIRKWWHSRQGVFCGLLFAGVSPGLNFAEFLKTRAEGLLGKFDIGRLHGHFGTRGLQQNVVLAVCSKMLCYVGTRKKLYLGHNGIRARVFFVAFFLHEFPLVATLQNFRKRELRVSLANLT